VAGILALDDEERIIAALWQLCYERLLRRVLRRGLAIELAEDILQDVFALLAERLEQVRDPRIVGWLNTVVDYECARHITDLQRARTNRRATVRHTQATGRAAVEPDAEVELDQRRKLGRTLQVLMGLEELDRFILRSSCLEDLSTAEILELIERRFGTSLTAAALYKRRSRIRRALARELRLRERRWTEREHHG